jgi:type II secretory pathway predicted ATPase ExeA
MTLRLKSVLTSIRIRQGALAQQVGISRPALVAIINHDHWLPSLDRKDIENRIERIVREAGADTAGLFDTENEKAPSCSNTTAPGFTPPTTKDQQETEMLLRNQVLTQATRRHFELPRDPFMACRSIDDVFLSGDIRYVREAAWDKVKHGGFMAIVGESGAGKSTIREEMIDRIQRESLPVHVIEPYVLAMEDNDTKGKTLRAQHIAEAIMATVAPLEATKSSPEARFRQLHKCLKESGRAGQSHVLVIEEAHSLPIPTLKHLKRFIELKDGLRPLVTIILFAQPELLLKLNEHDPNVREVVQRIEIVNLPPLNTELDGYLKHRFDRIGVPVARVLDTTAIDALRARLTPEDKRGTRGAGSLLFPLVVHNVLAAAMNTAADLGLPRVTSDVVKGV